MKKPSFAVFVTFDIKPEHVAAFRDRVLRQAADSLAKEVGCCQFDVLIDDQRPTQFYLYETYIDAAAFDTHRQTPHFADFNQTVTNWVASKQLLQLDLVENHHG